jgi:hypothetical protein
MKLRGALNFERLDLNAKACVRLGRTGRLLGEL